MYVAFVPVNAESVPCAGGVTTATCVKVPKVEPGGSTRLEPTSITFATPGATVACTAGRRLRR